MDVPLECTSRIYQKIAAHFIRHGKEELAEKIEGVDSLFSIPDLLDRHEVERPLVVTGPKVSKSTFFESFINENIISEGPFNRDQLYNNPPHADCYVCGSDQIWGRDDIYYISFVKGVKKIAYAPSIAGLARFSEQDYSRIRNLVQNYYKNQ